MAKYINPDMIDAALNYLKNNATRVMIGTAQPTNYTTFGTYAIGTLACSSANFTLADGDVSGRKVTFAAATIAVGTSGTINHVAWAGTSGSGTLLFVGTCAPTSVTAGGTVVINAVDVDEIGTIS